MTVNPEILEISNGADPINEWKPEYTRLFSVEITIALRCEVDDLVLFYLDVATPEFFIGERMPKFVNKILLVEEYNKDEIINFIENIIFEKKFDNIEKLYEHIRKYFRWEFDDYYILPNE